MIRLTLLNIMRKLAKDDTFDVKVLPAWRPDKAMNLEKPEYLDYLKKLSEVSGIEVKSFKTLIEAKKNVWTISRREAALYQIMLLSM